MVFKCVLSHRPLTQVCVSLCMWCVLHTHGYVAVPSPPPFSVQSISSATVMNRVWPTCSQVWTFNRLKITTQNSVGGFSTLGCSCVENLVYCKRICCGGCMEWPNSCGEDQRCCHWKRFAARTLSFTVLLRDSTCLWFWWKKYSGFSLLETLRNRKCFHFSFLSQASLASVMANASRKYLRANVEILNAVPTTADKLTFRG